MKRKVLLVVALMLALSITMAAMAYNGAYVWNAQTLRIVNTNDALIALNAPANTVVGHKDATITYNNGSMVFDFGSGLQSGTGLQPASEYRWDNLFSITNNSHENITVNISIDCELAKHLTLTAANSGTHFAAGTVFYSPSSSPYITLKSGETVTLNAGIWLHGASPLGVTGNALVVNCAAVN